MSMAAFKNPPSSGNQIGQNDYFTGDGSTTNFTLVNNTVSSLANTVQAGNAFYLKSNGSVSGSGSNMILSSAPGVSVAVIAPNQIFGLLAAYDRSPYSQTSNDLFAQGDITDIQTNYYTAPPGDSGIKVYFTNRIGSGGADPSWFQFSLLNAIDMSVAGYGSAGSPLYLPAIQGYSTLNGSVSSGANSIVMTDASSFIAGQWILIDDGANTDIVWVKSISSNTLNLLQNLSFSHTSGKNVYACANGLSIKMTVPTNAGGGLALNLFNCSLDVDYIANAR